MYGIRRQKAKVPFLHLNPVFPHILAAVSLYHIGQLEKYMAVPERGCETVVLANHNMVLILRVKIGFILHVRRHPAP